MKVLRFFLAALLALSLAAGSVSAFSPDTVSAATNRKVTVKAASDFNLKLPAGWKGQYVMKSSKGTKHGSYVAFYSKKCYQQTKEGWLFSIMRFADDSYVDMPDFELVGRWNGYSYVALFPTDVQFIGSTKAAQKQYTKLNNTARTAAASISPVTKKRSGDSVYQCSEYSLKLPAGWKDSYVVEEDDSCVAFYSKKCYEEAKEGWLFSIMRFTDDSYQEIPSYQLVGKWNGVNYVVSAPKVVPLEGSSEDAVKQYKKLARSVEEVIYTIQP